jgi:hypothetical protein
MRSRFAPLSRISAQSKPPLSAALSEEEAKLQDNVVLAKSVLSDNTKVLYGIFGIIDTSGYFPPRRFLNEFLLGGSDPCDQDGRMEGWIPFELSEEEYLLVLSWWQSKYPESVVDHLNSDNWKDWVQVILEE